MLEVIWIHICDPLLEWVKNLLEPLCAKGGWRKKLGLTLLFLFIIAWFGVTIWFMNH